METGPSDTDAVAALIWIGGYLALWLLLVLLSPRFRESFFDWMRWRDPFGLRFWRQNLLFAAFSFAYLAVALLFIGI